MKMVSELYGRHPNADIYVVGTAPSARVFPRSFFEGRILIGCNMAWKIAPVQYCVTIHPDTNIPEFMAGEAPRPEITWVAGHEKCKGLPPEQLSYAEATFHFFKYRWKTNTQPPHEPSDSGRVIDWVERPTGDWLYVWSSIAQTATNLAANMGASNVILIGCDNAPLNENHHAHQQHTRWKGVDPQHRYMQYYRGIAEVRAALRGRGVNVVTVNPFLKLDMPTMDFERLTQELGVPALISGHDVQARDRPPAASGPLTQLERANARATRAKEKSARGRQERDQVRRQLDRIERSWPWRVHSRVSSVLHRLRTGRGG